MLTKEEFVKTHPNVREGMNAYTTDGEKLGVIERVDEDNLTIERGWFFHKDFMIPYDDIEDIREDQVIVRQRHEDFEEGVAKEESRETGESEMGERAKGRVEEAGERAKETAERIGDEMSGYSGRREEEMRGYGRGRVEEKEDVVIERKPVSETEAKDLGGKAFQEEDIRIPLKEEEVEATKRPVVKEEVKVSAPQPAEKKENK